MKKLINLQVMPADKVICVWVEEEVRNDNDSWRSGIAFEKASRGYMIPRNVIIGVFDDGSAKAAGIFGLYEINNNPYMSDDYDDLFLYDQFVYYVDNYLAKALVNGAIAGGVVNTEEEARTFVFYDLKKAGVEISDEAEAYLKGIDR